MDEAPEDSVIQTKPNSLSVQPYAEKSGSMLASARENSGLTCCPGWLLPSGVSKFMMKAFCWIAKSTLANVAFDCGSEWVYRP